MEIPCCINHDSRGGGEGRHMILIAFILALLAIAADGGFTEEAFQNPRTGCGDGTVRIGPGSTVSPPGRASDLGPDRSQTGYKEAFVLPCPCKDEPSYIVDPLRIRTLEGELIVSPGDWIIRGVKGELYPCKPDIFEATYEKVME